MSIFEGPHGPRLVAEIGGNHEGDFDAAVRLADLALEAGNAPVPVRRAGCA
jgi:sialic acid synthase SpsE